MSQTKLPILMLQPSCPVIPVQELSGMVECPNPALACEEAERLGACLVLAHLAGPEDAARIISVMERLKEGLQGKRIRVMVTSELKDANLEKRVEFAGCSELIRAPFTEKSLLFKIGVHLKSLPRQEQENAGQVAVREPGIGNVMMAFLVSELMANDGLAPEQVAARACAYLSKSLRGECAEGPRVELWIRGAAGGWFCPGASDQAPGRLDPVDRGAPGRIEVEIPRQRFGALLIVEEKDPGSMPGSYLQIISRIFSGLAASFENAAA